MKSIFRTITILLVIVTSVSCGAKKSTVHDAGFPMGIHDIWALEKMYNSGAFAGATIPFHEASNHPTIEINTTQMKVFGNDGCNEFTGAISELAEKIIVFGKLASNKKMCKDMKTSTAYHNLLEATRTFKLKETKLIFLDDNNTPLLVFKKVD